MNVISSIALNLSFVVGPADARAVVLDKDVGNLSFAPRCDWFPYLEVEAHPGLCRERSLSFAKVDIFIAEWNAAHIFR